MKKENVKILGIESSCDETAVSIVEVNKSDKGKILSNLNVLETATIVIGFECNSFDFTSFLICNNFSTEACIILNIKNITL